MHLAGKLAGQAAIAATAGHGPPGRLMLLVDSSSKLSFLVDTGAVFSVIPHSSSLPAEGPHITNASGTPIACWGSREQVVHVGGLSYKWIFLLAAVAFPILGADFLGNFDLLVDLHRCRLIDGKTRKAIKLTTPPVNSVFASIGIQPSSESSSSPSALHHRLSNNGSSPSPLQVSAISSPAVFSAILEEFPEVLNPSKQLPPVKHNVVHHIVTEGRPVTAKYRRLDADRLEAAKRDFLDMEKQGIVRRSSSSWASPLHLVKKSDGTWRPCGDFRLLNLATKPDLYTCPNIGDLTSRLSGCKIFSKLDLRKGYHQVPVRPADVAKTAIITPFGLWEFLRMPFGLRNAGQSFQRLMDQILAGLDYVFVYYDDVLVASQTEELHQQHLRAVLQQFSDHGLVVNAEKCSLGVSELDYLGHHVSASGITPMADRVAAISKFPPPSTIRHLQTFLGMVNFYRRFMPQAAKVLKPLTDVLKGGARGQITWTKEMDTAFLLGKKAITEAVELAHPSSAADLSLAVDASESHIGAVLQQHHSTSNTRPLAFFSVKLDNAQRKYSAFDRELLAIYLSIRHFRWLLEGRRFCVLSDHKPLSFALHRLTDAWSARQQRQLSYIAEFTSDVRHVAGKANVVADALSRPAAAIAAPSSQRVDYTQLAAAQQVCQETATLRDSTALQVQEVIVGGQRLWCDISTGVWRPLVPVLQRRQVFEAIHSLAHPGIRASKRLITSRFVWPGCASDIALWCRECQHCSRSKVTVQETTAVETIPIPGNRFSHVHVDLVGPLPVSAEGYRYLLTIVDRTTRWPEAVPLTNITAETCADSFTTHWVARFGVPGTITTDRGSQFSGAVWECMCRTLGIRHIMTTAYHPQSNGLVERFHRRLKEALRARQCGDAWVDHLPWALLGIRSAPKEISGISSAEAVYGVPLALPGQAQGPAGAQVDPPPPVIAARTPTYAEVAMGKPTVLQKVEFVYVRRGPVGTSFSPVYSGPYRILSKRGKVYELEMGDKIEMVTADRLKPHTGTPPVVAVPPQRGRPPGTGGKH